MIFGNRCRLRINELRRICEAETIGIGIAGIYTSILLQYAQVVAILCPTIPDLSVNGIVWIGIYI